LPTTDTQTLEDLCINTIRFLSADAVQNANSGHPGMPMGAAAMAYTLWNGFLKHNPKNPNWIDRDRFVLSAGHGSMLLYSLLYLTGYDLPLDEIKRFRKFGSKTPGHPERGPRSCAAGCGQEPRRPRADDAARSALDAIRPQRATCLRRCGGIVSTAALHSENACLASAARPEASSASPW